MRRTLILSLILFLLFSSLVWAYDDKFGKPDTCRITVIQKEKSNKVEAKVWLFNDEDVAAMTVPIRFGDGKGSSLYCDSVSYANTRVQNFQWKSAKIDSTKNNVLLGLIAAISAKTPPLKPGQGEIGTIYFTIKKGVRSKEIVLDTCFVEPSNVLMIITDDVKNIVPVFDNKNARIKVK